jgi:heme/copper-type cytochrome/quinol oxidase subunit 2
VLSCDKWKQSGSQSVAGSEEERKKLFLLLLVSFMFWLLLLLFLFILLFVTRWRSQLKHCATSRKVAG